MKKFTKKFLKVATIVTASAGVLFGGAFGLNAMIENSNNNKIAETREKFEKYEQENRDKILNNSFMQAEFTYDRKEITNDKTVDFSEFTVPSELFTTKQGYLVPLNNSASAGYKNFQRNVHLYVYIDNNLSENEKKRVKEGVSYLNTVVGFIDQKYSVSIADQLQESNAYIHVLNDSNFSASAPSNALGVTELPELPSPLYNKPISIRMNTNNINKLCFGNYDALYKGTFIHEFLHASGLEHSQYFYDNEDLLTKPIMSATADSTNKDYLSIPELAKLFGWLNQNKYEQAERDGNLESVYNKDFLNYLFLIQYGLNQSLSFNINSPSIDGIKDNQVFQLEYAENLDSDTNCKAVITFNYPYKNFCEKIMTKNDGSIDKIVRPFVLTHNAQGNGRIVILNENCRSHDEMKIMHFEQGGSYLYKDGLTFNEVMIELRKMDPRNGYEVNFDNKTTTKHIQCETKNLWEYITNKTRINDIEIEEQLYKISYKLPWSIDGKLAEETTNYIDENMLSNYNVSYSDTNAESF